MKKVIMGVTTVALLTVGMTSTSHAWFFKTKVNTNVTSAGRDMNSNNRTYNNSFNRFNSSNVTGDVTKSNLGSMDTSARNISSGNNIGNSRGWASNSGLSNFGNYNNNGQIGIGSGQNTVTGGSITLGDTIMGDSAVKALSGSQK